MNPDDALAEYAHLRNASARVAKLITDVRAHLENTPAHEGTRVLELEARLGKLRPDGFEPNVGHASFCNILQLLESYPRWARVTQWQETHDVFYSVDLPPEYAMANQMQRRARIRTCVGADSAGDIEIVHQVKTKLQHVDMEMRVIDAESCSLETSRDAQMDGFDARISASLEQVVPPELLPIAVSPELVRIKQRKRFFLTSLGVEQEAFSFDLTIVYCGKSKSEAEKRQSAQEGASFEVEVECLQPRAYLKSSGGEAMMLALSLILKCHDFSSAMHASSAVTYVPVNKPAMG